MLLSHRLPTPIVDIRLQFSRNHGRNTLLHPDISIQCIVSFLVEEKLPASSKASIWLTVSVKIWRRIEATVPVVKVKHAAFPDIEEEPRIHSAPVQRLRILSHVEIQRGRDNDESDLLLHMLIATAFAMFVTA